VKKGIIGKKLGMTQIFDARGNAVPVTIIEAGPNVVAQIKTVEKEGYNAVQVGYGDIRLKYRKGQRSSRSEKFQEKPSNITLPLQGHFAAADISPKKVLRELRLDDISGLGVGDIITASIFAEGEKVDVSGVSKGKGYTGTIKRWNFGRLKESHGSGPVARHGGSIGACSDPSRVFKGHKMAGHLGAEKVTVQNLTVVRIDAENNLIALKGAVPGPKNSIVTVKSSVKVSGKEE